MPIAKPSGGQPEIRIIPEYTLTGIDGIIEKKNGELILTIKAIRDYQWRDRHVTMLAEAQSRSDLLTLEALTRKAGAGSVTIPIPGGLEEFQDLTSDEANTLHIIFRDEIKTNSNIKDGYYLLKPGFATIGIPGQIDQFLFSMNLFFIGENFP